VGSVGRTQTLRSDFFYKHGRVITARFQRIGKAMREGKTLPPLELYKVKHERSETAEAADCQVSEYFVVDGHHRVAMARKLGQDFLDAHVVEYRVAGTLEATPEESVAQGRSASSRAAAKPVPVGAAERIDYLAQGEQV
jgi:hypothetical protein